MGRPIPTSSPRITKARKTTRTHTYTHRHTHYIMWAEAVFTFCPRARWNEACVYCREISWVTDRKRDRSNSLLPTDSFIFTNRKTVSCKPFRCSTESHFTHTYSRCDQGMLVDDAYTWAPSLWQPLRSRREGKRTFKKKMKGKDKICSFPKHILPFLFTTKANDTQQSSM